MSKRIELDAVVSSLSSQRLSTYFQACSNRSTEDALTLYAWNAGVSAAFVVPVHICEVVLRNAVAEAISNRYGAEWLWSPSFERSLPDPVGGYSARQNLKNARSRTREVGKVIAELSFVFWEQTFTRRFEDRIWKTQIATVFPYLPKDVTVSDSRTAINKAFAKSNSAS